MTTLTMPPEMALQDIMRLASYLPLHSPERKAIEDAASTMLRRLEGDHSDGQADG